jgi:hypothetical protein
MPTHDEAPRFLRDLQRLTPAQRAQFDAAVKHFVADLTAGHGFRPELRVKRFRRLPGVWEMSWANDGRALFQYGTSPRAGDTHVEWLRIGAHDIFRQP